MFLWSGSTEINHHSIHPDLQLSSDHAPLLVTITIKEENSFIKDISLAIKSIDISDLSDSSKIKEATKLLASRIE